MITLITGLPGNGKTLYAIAWLKERAEKEGRQVYYNGIKECMVPGWIELPDAEQWYTVPAGSIVLIDEVQRVMRPRMHGSTVPKHIEQLETHRHLGIDLVLVTQQPMLLDSNARRLTGQHFHVVRKFGTHFATIHEWGAAKENCDKNRDDSIRHEWRYPKDVFALYKSAELHTHKRRIPMKVWVLLSLPLVLSALAYYFWQRQLAPHHQNPAAPTSQGSSGLAGSVGSPGGPTSARRYVEQFAPRVAGLQYTAPAYDEVTKPTQAPYPAACVHSASRCTCYSQQATRLDVPDDLCRRITDRGFFVAWAVPQPVVGAVMPAPAASPLQVAQAAPGFAGFNTSPMLAPPLTASVVNPPAQDGGPPSSRPRPRS